MEALFALAILAIVTAIAVPSFATLLSERRVTAGARAFAAALRKAQAEATARNRTVEVLFTAAEPSPLTVVAATPASAASARQWMVRQAAPADASAYVDGYSVAAHTPTVNVEATSSTVAFTPLGRPVQLAGGVMTPLVAPMVIRFTDAGSARRYCTYLTTGGAIRSCDPTQPSGRASACVPQLTAGAC